MSEAHVHVHKDMHKHTHMKLMCLHAQMHTPHYLTHTHRLHYVSIYIPPLVVTVYTVHGIYSSQCEQFRLHIILHILLSADLGV